MVKKERPQRVFRRGKKPLGKTSGKIREKKVMVQVVEGKNKVGKIQFPKINLIIAEVRQRVENVHIAGVHYMWGGVIIVGVMLCLWQLWVFGHLVSQVGKLAFEKTLVEAELHTWESISERYPTYRDAHVEAALFAYRVGKKDELENEVKKVLDIDPNFVLPSELLR